MLPVPHHQRVHDDDAQPGLFVTVNGRIESSEFIGIALAADRQNENIPFYISIRPGDKECVFNNKKDGEWQDNENRHNFNVHEGDFFTLSILGEDDEFDVYLNGDKYHSFNYREPVSDVRFVNVEGSIALESVLVDKKIDDIPYEDEIDGWQAIRVSGKSKHDFSVEIYDAQDDMVLYINPRFGQETVVLNTMTNGDWDSEERPEDFPFQKNDIFDIVIRDVGRAFMLKFNNNEFFTFEKRGFGHGQKLKIDGQDLHLYAVQVAQGEPIEEDFGHYGFPSHGRFGGRHGRRGW